MQNYPPSICPYPKYPCHLKIQFPSPLVFSLFLARARLFLLMLASSSPSSPSPSTIQMAPKRKALATKKFTNPKRSKVVDDVAQKQPTKMTMTTTKTTALKSVKETASKAPLSVQPHPSSPMVPPTYPQTVSMCLILFFKFRVKKI